MLTAIRNSVLAIALLNGLGCTSSMQVPTDDGTRGSLSSASSYAGTTTTEETDSQIRATVLDKIKIYLLRTGQYPKTAIEQTELLSLTPSITNLAPDNSTWNYQAITRVNLKNSSVKIQFLIFDRDGELILRRISV